MRLSSEVPLVNDNEPRLLSTCATANRLEITSNRSHSVIGHYGDDSSMIEQNPTDFTMHNVRRVTKLRRRSSLPITEEERDIIRYITSTTHHTQNLMSTSRYNFLNEEKMIRNMNLTDLQRHTTES